MSQTKRYLPATGDGIYDNRFRNALVRMAGAFGGCVFVAGGVIALFDERGSWATVVFFWVFGILVVGIPMSLGVKNIEPSTRIIGGEYGTFLARTTSTNGRLVVFIGLAVVFYAVTVAGIVRAFSQPFESKIIGALVITGGLGTFFAFATRGALRESKTVDVGLFLTLSGVVFRERMKPITLKWDEVSRVYAHWVKSQQWGQPASNWLTFERFNHAGPGSGPEVYRDVNQFASGTAEPTVDLEALSGDPRKIVAGVEYYLNNPQARSELGTSMALNRFK